MIKLVGEKLMQWQSDRQVEIVPRAGEIITRVECVVKAPRPLVIPYTMAGESAIAELPNRALLASGTICVCVEYMSIDCADVRQERQSFTVHKAEKPADFVFEPNKVLDEYNCVIEPSIASALNSEV